jgi:hypothetical protein
VAVFSRRSTDSTIADSDFVMEGRCRTLEAWKGVVAFSIADLFIYLIDL